MVTIVIMFILSSHKKLYNQDIYNLRKKHNKETYFISN